MKAIYCLLFLLSFGVVGHAQFMILPSSYRIKKPPVRGLSELALTPSLSSVLKSDYSELEKHYTKVLTESMNSWFSEKFPDSKIYDQKDSLIDIRKVQQLIHREVPVYEMFRRKPLFGYGGHVPTEGAYTVKAMNKLLQNYEVDYVVFTSIVSLYQDTTSKKYLKNEYKGHFVIYAWVVDTETGYIEESIKIKGKEFPNLSSGRKSFRPMYNKVNDEVIIDRSSKLQKKLGRKMNRLFR